MLRWPFVMTACQVHSAHFNKLLQSAKAHSHRDRKGALSWSTLQKNVGYPSLSVKWGTAKLGVHTPFSFSLAVYLYLFLLFLSFCHSFSPCLLFSFFLCFFCKELQGFTWLRYVHMFFICQASTGEHAHDRVHAWRCAFFMHINPTLNGTYDEPTMAESVCMVVMQPSCWWFKSTAPWPIFIFSPFCFYFLSLSYYFKRKRWKKRAHCFHDYDGFLD